MGHRRWVTEEVHFFLLSRNSNVESNRLAGCIGRALLYNMIHTHFLLWLFCVTVVDKQGPFSLASRGKVKKVRSLSSVHFPMSFTFYRIQHRPYSVSFLLRFCSYVSELLMSDTGASYDMCPESRGAGKDPFVDTYLATLVSR